MDRTQHSTSLTLLLLMVFTSLFPGVIFAAEAEDAKHGEAMITMDFQEVELPVLIKFISELTGKNFIIDEKVKGKKVTIISPTKITKEEAYKAFESILDIKGLATVPAGKVIKIVPAKEAAEKSLTTIVGNQRAPDSDTMITRLVPLKHVDSTEMVKIFKPLMSRESKIDAYGPTNTLIMTDTSSNISRLMRILKQLDVESDEMMMEVIPLEYASAEVLASQLQEILETMATPAPQPRTTSASKRRSSSAASRKSRTSSRTTKSGKQGFVGRILADDRTNSLIILTTQSQLQEIRELVHKLDYDTPRAYGNIHVYYLEYSNAEDTAKVLSDLVSGARSLSSAAGKPKASKSSLRRTMASFEGEVSITADMATNSLIIVASPRDYQTLNNVIEKLDIRRRQVYVEAVFMEISPSFLQDIGMEFRGGVPLEGGDEVDQALLGGTNYNLGTNEMFQTFAAMGTGTTPESMFPMDMGTASGLTLGAVFDHIKVPDGNGNDISLPASMFLLHALQRVTRTNILSTPHLIAIDNQESEIVVGQNVPFITSTSQTTVSTVQQVQRENVGITLRFTPQITEGDFIQLELYQEISALIESPIGQDVNRVGPTTSNRKATSMVLVRDGQTIVVGGLMEDRIRTTKNKVPWLGDIPVLGWLFRYDTDTVEKSNLLIFLTPTIIREDADVQQLYEEHKRKMQKYKKRHKISDKFMDIDPFAEMSSPALPGEEPPLPDGAEVLGTEIKRDPNVPDKTQQEKGKQQEPALPKDNVTIGDPVPEILPPATDEQ